MERLLVLSVDSAVSEDQFSDAVRDTLDNSQLGSGLVGGLANRLKDTGLDDHTGTIMENLFKEQRKDFEIIKKSRLDWARPTGCWKWM